ncbi:MAG: hypothetical protein IPN33_25975 [Saprospiraceae bacterium]|nr:hypothetical protein [Saprospiraceae bacterium]
MNIILPKDSGYIAVGEYQAGQIYDVEEAEAKRLISVKGFRAATAKEAGEAAKTETSKEKAAAPDAP